MGLRQSGPPSADHISTNEINLDKRIESPRLPNWVMAQLCRYLFPLFLFEKGSGVLLNTKGKIFGKMFDKVAGT